MAKVSAVDIQHKVFRRGLFGYDRVEVDRFLEDLMESVEEEAIGRAQLEKELAEVREKCPIERLKRYLVERGINAADLDLIGERTKEEVQQAVARALEGPRPEPATVLDFVYRAPSLAAIPG